MVLCFYMKVGNFQPVLTLSTSRSLRMVILLSDMVGASQKGDTLPPGYKSHALNRKPQLVIDKIRDLGHNTIYGVLNIILVKILCFLFSCVMSITYKAILK